MAFTQPKRERIAGSLNSCGICGEDYGELEGDLMSTDPNAIFSICGPAADQMAIDGKIHRHSFCYGCLARYLTEAVRSDKDIISCPDPECLARHRVRSRTPAVTATAAPAPAVSTTEEKTDAATAVEEERATVTTRLMSDGDLGHFVGNETMRVHLRFRRLRGNKSLRDCPRCQSLVGGGSNERPELACQSCGHRFCFKHGDQHPGHGCFFVKESPLTSVPTRVRLFFSTRTCPNGDCQSKIVRNGGCPNMTCQRCQTHFCYYCGSLQGRTTGSCKHLRLLCVTSPISVPLAIGIAGVASPFLAAYGLGKLGEKASNRIHRNFPQWYR